MLTKIRIIFVLVILAGGGLLGMSWSASPGGFRPYPYRFKSFEPPGREEAARSDVLIVGDRMGERLAFYTNLLKESGSIYNWSETGEGLHRTLNKLRRLSRLPPVVIYHGGVDEFYEKKFDPAEDYGAIRQNLILHRKHGKSFWARQLPHVAAFFLYSTGSMVSLGEEPLYNAKKYGAFDKQKQMELTYHLFELEFRQLLSFFREKESTLIVIPPPLNLDMPPGKVCSNTVTQLIDVRQNRLQKLLQEGGGAGLVASAEQLAKDSPGNTRSFYLRGLAYKSAGELRNAKASLYRARLFDCDTSQGSIIFNKTMVTAAEKQNFTIIDFNSMVNNNFGEEGLFVESFFPQKRYYQQLMGILKERLSQQTLK